MLTDEEPFPVAVAVDEPGFFWMTDPEEPPPPPPPPSAKRRRVGMVLIAAGS